MRLIGQPGVAFQCIFVMSFHPRLKNIVDQLLKHPTRSVKLALGELFALDEEALHMQWDQLVAGTSLASAELSIHVVRAQQQCMICFEKYHPLDTITSCPHCGSVGAKILTGEELYVEAVEAMNG
jgi:Zn finger protein HypA/HybF involved in hydrogenase expression